MTNPHVHSTIPNSYVDQKDGFKKKKKVSYVPSGWKRKSRGVGKNGTPRQKETWRDKRDYKTIFEKREKVKKDGERGKKVEEERCTGEETGRGCCQGFSGEVVHGGGGGKIDAEDDWENERTGGERLGLRW